MADSTLLTIRVTPRSSRDELQGWQDGVLRVRLKAPPVDGRANEALCRFIAGTLGIPASSIAVAGGQTARTKRLRIEGMTEEEVLRRLGA